MLELLPAPGRVLDMGCGSGRLTAVLAERGWSAVGIDTHDGRLEQARERSHVVEWRFEDMNEPLAFDDGELDAVVSRCSLMIASDPVETLREVRRVLRPGGVVVTEIWAAPERNRWFSESRAAVADALGPDRARFARRLAVTAARTSCAVSTWRRDSPTRSSRR
jgi:SAM-dependent methyltransferase